MNYSVKSFNTGQITLPKKWRDKYQTNIFTAQETEDGLLIVPIFINQKRPNIDNNDVEYFEDEKGMYIKFKKGIEAGQLLKIMKDNV